MTDPAPELRKCPHCGGNAFFYIGPTGYWRVTCDACLVDCNWPNQQEAAAAWNRRAEERPAHQMVYASGPEAELEKMIAQVGQPLVHGTITPAWVARKIIAAGWRRAEEEKMETRKHAADCAVHNMPAYPVGACDCGAAPATEFVRGWKGKDSIGNEREIIVDDLPGEWPLLVLWRGHESWSTMQARANGFICGGARLIPNRKPPLVRWVVLFTYGQDPSRPVRAHSETSEEDAKEWATVTANLGNRTISIHRVEIPQE